MVFGRITLVHAAEFLEGHSQAAFNQMVIRLELEQEIPAGTGMSVQKKCVVLARIVTLYPETPLRDVGGTHFPWGGHGSRGSRDCEAGVWF